MQLINLQTQSQSSKPFPVHFIQQIQYLYPHFYISQHKSTSIKSLKYFTSSIILFKFNSQTIFANILIDFQFAIVYITIKLANILFTKCRNSHQKKSYSRYNLKLSYTQKNLHFLVDPKSGDLIYSMKINIGISQKINFSYIILFTTIIQYLQEFKSDIKNNFINILALFSNDFLNYQENLISLKRQNYIRELKTYASSSPHYAWNILQGKTLSNKISSQSIYAEKKQIFRCYRRNSHKKQSSINLVEIFNICKKVQPPIFALKIDQDMELKNNYLIDHFTRKRDSKIVNYITMTNPEQFENIQNNTQKKISTQELGRIKIFIEYNKNSATLRYQKSIVQFLSKNQFIGLPKYYFIKNPLNTLENYVFTNLYHTLPFNQYLQNNNQTISIETKLYLFIQIVTAIKFLKQNFTIYHNLTPKTIKLKKGLIAKLIDFTVSYNQNIKTQQMTPFRNTFPYVSNIFYGNYKTIDHEKSDSYSLGVLIYQCLYGKKILQIKPSTIKNLNQKQIFKRLSKNQLKSIQISNELNGFQARIWLKFILDATSHQYITKKDQQKNVNEQINIKARPFLDWFSIILKHSYEFYLKSFN